MANIIPITDFSDSALDLYARLTENQLLHYFEPQTGIFIAESPMVITRALQAGYQPISFLMEEKYIPEAEKTILADWQTTPVYVSDFDTLKQLTGFPLTRGALCAMYRKPLEDMAYLCRDAKRIAVLENVVNPTNVGAIFRSAAALHMDAVLLTQGCSDPLYRRSVRVSMGTVFQIPWTLIGNDWLKELKALGFHTAAMALRDDTISIADSKWETIEKLAIVLGTEGEGLAAATISGCDDTIRIPMAHGVDSLNVAAAAAVAFWQLGSVNRRQE